MATEIISWEPAHSYWNPKTLVSLFYLLFFSTVSRHHHKLSGFEQSSILYCRTFSAGITHEYFKHEEVCCDIYCVTLVLLACRYLFLWPVGTIRQLWLSLTFPLDNVQHIYEFVSISAALEFECWKVIFLISLCTGFQILTLRTTNKNCSLFTFFVLNMISLGFHRALSHTYPYPSLQGYIISFLCGHISYHWEQRHSRL